MYLQNLNYNVKSGYIFHSILVGIPSIFVKNRESAFFLLKKGAKYIERDKSYLFVDIP